MPLYAVGHPGERPPASLAPSEMEERAARTASRVGASRNDGALGKQLLRCPPEK